MSMEGTRRLDRWDTLLVFAILAAILVSLRLQKPDPPRQTLMPTFGSSGMDAVWRDSLRPMSPEDLRPRADPDIAWEDETPAAETVQPQAVAAVEPAPEPARAAEPAPEPELEAPAFEKPKIHPLTNSLAESGYSNRSQASYRLPQTQAPAAQAAPQPQAPRSASNPPAPSSNPTASAGRVWRRVAAP